MNKRSREMLLLFAEQQKNWTISKLAKRFKVSERTIRNDISDINDYLKQQKIAQIRFGSSGRLMIENDMKKVKILQRRGIPGYRIRVCEGSGD